MRCDVSCERPFRNPGFEIWVVSGFQVEFERVQLYREHHGEVLDTSMFVMGRVMRRSGGGALMRGPWG